MQKNKICKANKTAVTYLLTYLFTSSLNFLLTMHSMPIVSVLIFFGSDDHSKQYRWKLNWWNVLTYLLIYLLIYLVVLWSIIVIFCGSSDASRRTFAVLCGLFRSFCRSFAVPWGPLRCLVVQLDRRRYKKCTVCSCIACQSPNANHVTIGSYCTLLSWQQRAMGTGKKRKA